MTENTASKPINQATAAELTEAIAELEQYRQRLVTETMDTAKRAKITKSHAEANLDQTLGQIDTMLQELRTRQEALLLNN